MTSNPAKSSGAGSVTAVAPCAFASRTPRSKTAHVAAWALTAGSSSRVRVAERIECGTATRRTITRAGGPRPAAQDQSRQIAPAGQRADHDVLLNDQDAIGRERQHGIRCSQETHKDEDKRDDRNEHQA